MRRDGDDVRAFEGKNPMRNNLRKARFLAVIVVVAVTAATTVGVCQKARKTLPSAARQDMRDRWFYVSYHLDDEVGTDGVVKLLERAGKVNLNGMLWEAPWDRADEWSADEIARFERVKEAANAAKVEIIPILWSIGYGTTAARNLNLAEGLPIRNLPFVVREGRANFVSSSDEFFRCDMEKWRGNKLDNPSGFQDRAGTSSFCDREVFHGGAASLRFEKTERRRHGQGRVMWELSLAPERLYRASIWIKTDDFVGRPLIQAYSKSDALIAARGLNAKANADGKTAFDWRKAEMLFRAPKDGKIRIYAGVWGGKSGKIWLDDLAVEPAGLVHPLQRPGAPITVASADGATQYSRGKD